MSVLLDTNVVVADVRSRSGSSNPLLVSAFHGRFQWCCSVPLFYEYEDVLGRADFLLDTRTSRHEIEEFLTDVARTVVPVELHFLWRPQLYDPADEMVLETAVNAGAAAIVTHNVRDFGDAPGRFGCALWTPAQALRRLLS